MFIGLSAGLITAVSAATPLLIATGMGIRWLGQQIWAINRLLATQNEAILWQNEELEKMASFDQGLSNDVAHLLERVSDIERYLETNTPTATRGFIIRGKSSSQILRTRQESRFDSLG